MEPMTSADTAADRVTVPVRLDVDTHAAAFSRAMSHLDNIATAQLDTVGIEPGLRVLLRLRVPAQRLRLLRRHPSSRRACRRRESE